MDVFAIPKIFLGKYPLGASKYFVGGSRGLQAPEDSPAISILAAQGYVHISQNCGNLLQIIIPISAMLIISIKKNGPNPSQVRAV